MANRIIAIGDIHGCVAALRGLLREIGPDSDDTIVALGDYVNRGPEGKGVIDELIELQARCRLIALLGNHEEMLLANRARRTMLPGDPPSDPDNGLEYFLDRHFTWLESCPLYFETETHIFVHANFQSDVDLSAQDRYTLLWLSLNDSLPKPHRSGKIAIVGHTSQKDGRILDRRHLKCIDTYCYGGGWLTGLDVASGRSWQVNRDGVSR